MRRRAAQLAGDAETAAYLFQAEAAVRSAEWSWRAIDGDVVDVICQYSGSADLVVVGQYEWQQPAERHPLPVAHSLIRRCGRPVLVVPADVEELKLRRVAIAWKGSREDVRAVHDALPLLLQATSIEIVVAGAEASERDSAAALAQHLCRHGCSPEPRVIRPADGASQRSVLELAFGDHDLLVVGGSSHPAWQEVLFGGVTSSILLRSEIPILAAY